MVNPLNGDKSLVVCDLCGTWIHAIYNSNYEYSETGEVLSSEDFCVRCLEPGFVLMTPRVDRTVYGVSELSLQHLRDQAPENWLALALSFSTILVQTELLVGEHSMSFRNEWNLLEIYIETKRKDGLIH